MTKNTRTRILLVAVASLLLVTMAVGGTIAYLQATTNTITNNFTGSTVSVQLQETENTYRFIPGVDISKDPKVTATADVDAYVFVKIDETNWPTTKVPYALAEGWNPVTGATETVYYREIASNGNLVTQTWSVLESDEIPVPSALTKEEIAAFFVKTEGETQTAQEVKLAFTAYIFQKDNGDTDFGALEAWNLVKPATSGN